LVKFSLYGAGVWRQGVSMVTCIWDRFGLSLCVAHDEAIQAPKKPVYTFYTRLLPVEVAVWGRSEERVHARGIGPEAGDHLVERDHVAFALRHLRAIFDHHALGEEMKDRLVVANQSNVAHELGPEARINKVQNGVFHTADVLVDGEPVFDRLRVKWAIRKPGIGIPVEIPGRIHKGIHGIGLTARRAAAFGTRCIHELR